MTLIQGFDMWIWFYWVLIYLCISVMSQSRIYLKSLPHYNEGNVDWAIRQKLTA